MPSARNYSPKNFTWGYELEVGDVPKSIQIPERLGRWEWAETDIVNLLSPYKYVAADPLGINPPVGGEVNTVPTKTIPDQLDKIRKLIKLFGKDSRGPTVSNCIMESHIHVRVPGLEEDIGALKRLTEYILANQQTVVNECVRYREHPKMKETKTARTYLKWDMGRQMPQWMGENILGMAESFEDFIRIQCCGKDGRSRGRPFRYCVNTYCMKHTGTIEFRCFRASLDIGILENCFRFVQNFMCAALNEGPPAEEIIKDYRLKFPPFEYRHEEYLGWENTKWDKSRGKKQRKFIPVE